MDNSSDADFITREQGDVLILRLKIQNFSNAYDIRRVTAAIGKHIDGGVRKLVLDLKHVQYAGSAALGMLLQLAQKMKDVKGKLALSHTEHIAELLRISKTDKLFQIAPDPIAAIKLVEK